MEKINEQVDKNIFQLNDRMLNHRLNMKQPDFSDPFQNISAIAQKEDILKLESELKKGNGVDALLKPMKVRKNALVSEIEVLHLMKQDLEESLLELEKTVSSLNTGNPHHLHKEQMLKRAYECQCEYYELLAIISRELQANQLILKYANRDIHWITSIIEENQLTTEDQLAATACLFDAVKFGCRNLTEFCIKPGHGARLDATNMTGQNVLFKSIHELPANTCDIVKILVNAGMDVNSSYPSKLGIHISLIMEMMINRTYFKKEADDYHEKMALTNQVINQLFVLGADVPMDLSDKGKAEFEATITKESRAQRTLDPSGKSFMQLYENKRHTETDIMQLISRENHNPDIEDASSAKYSQCLIS